MPSLDPRVSPGQRRINIVSIGIALGVLAVILALAYYLFNSPGQRSIPPPQTAPSSHYRLPDSRPATPSPAIS